VAKDAKAISLVIPGGTVSGKFAFAARPKLACP
jgi:hypothetical protein